MEITVEDPSTGAKYLTNPARDVAFFGPQIFEQVAARCLPEALTDGDRRVLSDLGLPPDAVFRAWQCVAEFHRLAVDPDCQTVPAAIDRSGLRAHPEAVQSLVLVKYAQAMLGAVWAGLRSSAMNGVCPAVVTNLLRRGAEAAEALSGG